MKENKSIYLAMFIALLIAITVFIYASPKLQEFVYGLKTHKIIPAHYVKEETVTFENFSSVGIYCFSYKPENLLAWKRILKTAGIPYKVCENLQNCLNTKIVILLSDIDKPQTLTDTEEKTIKNFVSNGGIVVGDGVFLIRYGKLKDLFGYKYYKSSKNRKSLIFQGDYLNPYINEKEEKKLGLSHLNESIWTNGIIVGTAKTLACFEDKVPAIVENNFGKGKAILIGFSAFDITLRNLLNRDFQANKKYINDFEPLSDILVLFAKDLYEKTYPIGFTLHTAPYGYKATLIISHDVDSVDASKNLVRFAEIEKNLGIRSTFFVQTKYQNDYNDKPFFNDKLVNILQKLYKDGFEIGSHTVIHTKLLPKLPFGTCNEEYPFYNAKVTGSYEVANNPTLCGELKVSKNLLEGADIKVESFRPGDLVYHYDLPIAMEKIGYKFSSTFSAEDILTYFPYKLIYKDYSKESSIIEIPVAVEDEEFPPLYFRLNSTLNLFKKIYNNGGVMVILIHPDLTWWKIKNIKIKDFLKDFIKNIPNDTWIATFSQAGHFWEIREAIRYGYEVKSNKVILSIYSPEEAEGITFKKNSNFKIYSDNNNVRITNNYVVIEKIPKGVSVWEFTIF